jgi:hypothetical protein
MKYGLDLYRMGSTVFTSLSKEEYRILVCAADGLLLTLLIEEQLDLVIGNYLEFEDDLLSMAARWMVSVWPEYEYMQRERNLIVNRRFLNLVNACRGYLDHARHHVNKMQTPGLGSTPRYLDEFNKYTNEEYDTFLAYRVMEAMRNYTQHAGFPLAVTYDATSVGGDDDRRLRYLAIPFFEVERLERGFKSSVRKELEDLGGRVDVMPMVRQYVASLANIHEKLRELLKSSIDEWEKALRSAIDGFKNDKQTDDTLGLRVIKITGDGRTTGARGLHLNQMEYRRTLEKKNRNLGTLARRYVSSESR